jgi:hypothetical protein
MGGLGYAQLAKLLMDTGLSGVKGYQQFQDKKRQEHRQGREDATARRESDINWGLLQQDQARQKTGDRAAIGGNAMNYLDWQDQRKGRIR